MKRLFLLICVVILLVRPYHARAQEPRDKLLEQALLWRVNHEILTAVGSLFDCERILDIQGDPKQNNHFVIKAEVVTFTGPHNPPYDLVTLTMDLKAWEPAKVLHMERKKNISTSEVMKRCDPAVRVLMEESQALTEQN